MQSFVHQRSGTTSLGQEHVIGKVIHTDPVDGWPRSGCWLLKSARPNAAAPAADWRRKATQCNKGRSESLYSMYNYCLRGCVPINIFAKLRAAAIVGMQEDKLKVYVDLGEAYFSQLRTCNGQDGNEESPNSVMSS
jgi:hypothetical protein